MTTRISLSEPLAELCARSWHRCIREVAGNPCSCTAAEGPAEARPLEMWKRWVNLPKPRACGQCEFLLLVQAIDHLVPVEEQRDWLAQPNMDLDGRSPDECLGAAAYEAVFTALCLLDPSRPGRADDPPLPP